MDSSIFVVAVAFFISLLFLVGIVGVILFLNGRSQKVQELKEKVETQGWQWLSGNTTDYKFQGKSKGRRWLMEYVNYDLRVTWSTKDVAQQPVVVTIEPRKHDNATMRPLAIALAQRFNVIDKKLKIREVFVGSESYHKRYITLSSLPSQEVQSWLTNEIEEQLLNLPPELSDQISLTYDGRSLYVICRETRGISPYSPNTLMQMMKVGLLAADTWASF